MQVNFESLAKLIISTAVLLLGIGLLILLLSRLGLQRTPGDIVFRRGGFTFFFPVGTSIVISLLLTFIFYLINKFR